MVEREFITFQAEANDNPGRIWRNERLVPEIFPGKCVRNVDFNDRSGNCFYRIANSNGSVCVSRGIQDNSCIRKSRQLDFVNNFAFNIALEIIEIELRKFLLKDLKIRFKRLVSVNFGFAFAQKIQVWPVDDHDFHSKCCLYRVYKD